MTHGTIATTVTGGQIQGIAGAGTVVIENFTIYNRSVEEPATTDAAGELIAPCPYPGLTYFGPGDAHLFFGRGAAITRLAEAVGRQKLTALVGASGSGKSSVVLAGLAPRLDAAGGWRFTHFRIGTELESNPFLALARALVPLYVAIQSDTERLHNTKQLAASLQVGELTLRDVFADCRSRNKGTRILLIADQFEEAFTRVEDEALLHRFIDVLLAGVSDPAPGGSPDICLILTLRADFYGRALRYRPLADALQGRVENLGPMNREELQAAIRRPAENDKVSFESGLVETLLDDVESEPGSLPLLQFALREMWARQQNRKITRKSYDDIGRVEGALAQRAETIFARMTENGASPQMARAFRRLFTRLVTLGEGQEDTRRVVDRRELGDDVWALAQRLAGENNRLIVTNAPAFSRETAELAHEALIRHWPALVGWINGDRTFQTWLRQIRSNVELWSADPSDDGPLLRRGMLAQAREWLANRRDDLSAVERSYIEASIALQRQAEEEREAARQAEIRRQQELAEAAVKLAEARQAEIGRQQELAEAAVKLAAEQRRRARIAIVGGIVATVLAIIAVVAGFEAHTSKQRADLNAETARQAASQAQVERDRARTQLLAMQARRTNAEATLPDEIALAGALALESIQLTSRGDRPAEADAIEVARSALVGLPLIVCSHGSDVWSLAALKDGRLASGGRDGNIKVWPKAGTCDPVTLSQGSPVRSLVVLADGRLASGGQDGRIKIWSKDGQGEPAVLSHGSPVRSLAVLKDGRLASGGQDGRIKIWSKDGQGEPAVLSHGGPVRSLAVLKDGRLASASPDGNIKLWSRDGVGKPVVLFGRWKPDVHDDRVSLAALADGRLASSDGFVIKLWPMDGKGEPEFLKQGSQGGISNPVLSLVELSDGRLASAGYARINLWPKEGGGEPVVLSHENWVLSLAVLADGRLASGGQDGTIKVWPKDGVGEPVVLPNPGPAGVTSLAVLKDGRLANGDALGNIAVWSPDDARDPVILSHTDAKPPEPFGWSVRLAALLDGRLASASNDGDGTIKLWPKGSKGEPVILLQGSPVVSMAVLADGRLATGGEDGKIKLWPTEGKGAPVVLLHGNEVSFLVVLTDGRLASGGPDSNIKLWPRDGLGEPMVLVHGSGVSSIAELADGRLASASADGNIKLWPRDGVGEPVVLSRGRPGVRLDALAALADGRLASGGYWGDIKLWPKDGVGEPVVLSHGGRLSQILALPDGRLASVDPDGIKLWLVNEQELVAALCRRAGRNLTKEEWARYIGSETPWQPSCRDLPSNWRNPGLIR
jgi:WD40 repeat protein